MTEWIELLVRDRTVWRSIKGQTVSKAAKIGRFRSGTGISDAVGLYDGEWMSTSMTQRSMLEREEL